MNFAPSIAIATLSVLDTGISAAVGRSLIGDSSQFIPRTMNNVRAAADRVRTMFDFGRPYIGFGLYLLKAD